MVEKNCSTLPASSLNELPLVIQHPALAHLVNDLQPVILSLSEQNSRPVDVGLPLHGILVLQVQPGNLQVSFKLVVHAVLLLSCLKRNSHQYLKNTKLTKGVKEIGYPGCLTPVLLALIYVGKVLSHATDLLMEILHEATRKHHIYTFW